MIPIKLLCRKIFQAAVYNTSTWEQVKSVVCCSIMKILFTWFTILHDKNNTYLQSCMTVHDVQLNLIHALQVFMSGVQISRGPQ